jgi:pimeloyl-ACP methyl ester carboxylesterase
MNEKMLPMVGIPKPLLKELTNEKKDELLNGVLMSGFPISRRTKGVINDMYLSNPDINNSYPFEKIKVPVLIFSAKDDPMCLYEGALTLSEKLPNVKLVSYENGGHLLLDHEKETQKEISNFISLNNKRGVYFAGNHREQKD